MTSPSHPALLWFRRDLRLTDHAALDAALASNMPVLPVFILDEGAPGSWPPGGAGLWWLHHSLAALQRELATRGAPLVLRRGQPATILPELLRQTGATTVHAGRLHEPHERQTEQDVAAALTSAGGKLVLHNTATLFEPGSIRTKTGGVYGMFTPFARACQAEGVLHEPIQAPSRIPAPQPPDSDELAAWGLLPAHPDWAAGFRESWTCGEQAALARLDAFLHQKAGAGVDGYATGRNLPGEDGTSRLSPHLHWGELSVRAAWHRAKASPGQGAGTFLNELLWREFSAYLLWHHPSLPEQPLRPAFAALPFRHAPAELRAWQRGRTGFPIVDAGMRQLWYSGWMHNRVRMVAASFLVKQLLIDWRVGARWFWDTLVDADLASNSASWQWVSGCGIDSQPFFRVFNPVSQGERWDPRGAYVRRWVPELAKLPDRYLHAPWTAPDAVLAQAGVRLGHDYPVRIVDLAAARTRALETYRETVRKDAA